MKLYIYIFILLLLCIFPLDAQQERSESYIRAFGFRDLKFIV